MLRLVPPSPDRAAGPSTRALDDHALVSAARAGDTSVSSALCNRLWPQVDRTIRKLLGRRDTDHEDLSQLALFELVRTIDRYRGDCSLDTWAQTVTAHVVFKYIRRRRTERRIALLRAVEAIRMHAAGHGGMPPTSLAEVNVVPVPGDPVLPR